MPRFLGPNDTQTIPQGVTYRLMPSSEVSVVETPSGVGQVPLNLLEGGGKLRSRDRPARRSCVLVPAGDVVGSGA